MQRLVDTFTLPESEKIIDCEVNFKRNFISLTTNKNRTFEIYHNQDCSENVWLEDIGDLEEDTILSEKLVGFSVRTQKSKIKKVNDYGTWTFIKLKTDKDVYTIRFCGTSNGYYSETASVYVYSNRNEDEDLEDLKEFFHKYYY